VKKNTHKTTPTFIMAHQVSVMYLACAGNTEKS